MLTRIGVLVCLCMVGPCNGTQLFRSLTCKYLVLVYFKTKAVCLIGIRNATEHLLYVGQASA